ncbi:MAG: GTP pyrophosphokinase [Bacteroidota bacterium]|nr:GTP pyrophosphokinase [Bacteroidota bacterium]
MMNELLEKALTIATKAHEGQKDRGGNDYIGHPNRVSERCQTDDERIVALLHDTIEDTKITAEYLLDQGFPERIVDAIVALSRREDEAYESYVDRAAANPIAKEVKKADLCDNMDVSRLNYPLIQDDLQRLNKYLKAFKRLTKEE